MLITVEIEDVFTKRPGNHRLERMDRKKSFNKLNLIATSI
jgi:hypothetical protein